MSKSVCCVFTCMMLCLSSASHGVMLLETSANCNYSNTSVDYNEGYGDYIGTKMYLHNSWSMSINNIRTAILTESEPTGHNFIGFELGAQKPAFAKIPAGHWRVKNMHEGVEYTSVVPAKYGAAPDFTVFHASFITRHLFNPGQETVFFWGAQLGLIYIPSDVVVGVRLDNGDSFPVELESMRGFIAGVSAGMLKPLSGSANLGTELRASIIRGYSYSPYAAGYLGDGVSTATIWSIDAGVFISLDL